MISRSRTPSPTKSPRRAALSSKDSNIRQPLAKSLTPQLSPLKDEVQRSCFTTRASSRTPSPTKQQSNVSNFFQNKQIPQLGFTIFSDDKDYSTEQQIATSLKVSEQDENDYTYNKENINFDQIARGTTISPRKVLKDLNIAQFPGAVEYPRPGQATKQTQLDIPWTNNNQIRIPSYVTPPRKNRTKYVSFECDRIKPLKRSNSQSDLDPLKVVKKLVFDIHKD
jgi:hypothetical protein